ncbi:MAG: glycosyltransferase family 39 protein [Lacunisphaera sp.]|nr:glycosyltransferase family 39 protein [Lacunisphaera sp.]
MKVPFSARRWFPWIVAVLLILGSLALRWPTLDFKVWNVDEAIHAAIARTLLDGGVLYRDAIDQRTPLTYYAVAVLFRIGGENNIRAMHLLAVALIAATAFGLFLLGRRWRGPAAGLWAALLFTVLATGLFFPGDAFALNTEWFVAGFTTWAAWFFWRGSPAGAGALLGLAFLSKQPALLDLGAPLAVLVYLARDEGGPRRRPVLRLAVVLAGFAAPVLLVLAYFAARGALADFYFYAWRYNLDYYAPALGAGDRVTSALQPFHLLAARYPLVLAALLGTAGHALFRVLPARPAAGEKTDKSQLLYVLVWGCTSLAGAASGGRGYDHYFIQFLPAGCLLAGLGLAGLTAWAGRHRARRFLRPATLLLSAVVLLQLGFGLAQQRRQSHQPVDPSLRAGEFIAASTRPDERIFVWGYHPDLYLFADRKPASRFVYGSFLSGLIPWTNTAPAQDTAYAIVPGARETLLRELAAVRPAFIVDCSAGPNRFWDKYPLTTFPPLQAYVAENYFTAEADRFAGQGFRLYLIKDSARRAPPPLAGGAAESRLGVPSLAVTPAITDPPAVRVNFGGSSATGRLQRLELLLDGAVQAAASFPPTAALSLSCAVPFAGLGAGEHRLSVRATAANGETVTGAEQPFRAAADQLPAARLAEFALPQAGLAQLPLTVRAPFGATVGEDGGHRIFQMHAPALARYALTGQAIRLRGQFGILTEAYAATNPSPTDGAEFMVVFVPAIGARQTLWHRLLRPAREPADTGPQPFSVTLPAGVPGTLELEITNGPAGQASSDWTYWSDLQLETSR